MLPPKARKAVLVGKYRDRDDKNIVETLFMEAARSISMCEVVCEVVSVVVSAVFCEDDEG